MPQNTRKLADIQVLYIHAFGDPADSAPGAFAQLESVVPLKGRKFYGVFYPQCSEYRACVEVQEGDDFESVGLSIGTIPGGLYAFERLRGRYEDIIKQIGVVFSVMQKQYKVDQTRPSIEFYRRHDEFILYQPILEE